tara:strand:+ start:4222 stop:4488 length:267 start_codon:yes stop_codon:yes gene_type:complete
MEANLVLSVGTILSVVGLFYSWHKDSKSSAQEVAKLTARVDSLEARAKQSDAVMQELLNATQDIKVALARIDTKLTSLEQEFNRSLQN